MTRRQRITAAAYLFGDRRTRPTHAELGARFGVCRSAITRRLKRFIESLSDEQRQRYAEIFRRDRGRRRRLWPVQLSTVTNV